MNDMRLCTDAHDENAEIERYRAPALDKGLDILELLSEQQEGLTRTEITKELGRNASEIYRMLERLVARRYVTRSTGGDRYTLSLKLFALAHRHPPMNRLVAEALPPMQRFANTTEQSCHLSVYDHGNLLVVAQADGPCPWGLSVKVGARIGLADSASGRVMLAFQAPAQRAQMLSEHGKVDGAPLSDERELIDACHAIRHAGFLRRESHQALGVTDVSYPVLGPSGHAIATLTCSHLRRIDMPGVPSLDTVDKHLRDTAKTLSMYRAAAN